MTRLPIALAGVVLTLCASVGVATAAPSRCASAKLVAVAASASCLLGLEGKQAKSGAPADAAKLQRCRDKLASAFGKAESKPPCLTGGDAPALQTLVDELVAELDGALSVGLPNACQASKLKAGGKAARCLLRLRAKAARTDTPPDAQKLQKCEDKLSAAFAKLEREPVCGTAGDAPAIAILIAAFAEEADAQLIPGGIGPSLDQWTYHQVTASHERTFGLAFGDVNGDGDADIVSGRTWYANPGGDMTGAWTQSPAFPNGVHAMLIVDVDGDAFPDVIAQGNRGSEVYWLEATNGAGTSWSSTPIGTLPQSPHDEGMQGYRVAQLEAGGLPEVALSSGDGLFYFRVPAANPDAGSWPRVRVSQSPSDEGFGVADVDGDGDLDVAAGTADGQQVEWYRNPGDGSQDWTAFPLGDVSDFGFPDRFALADLNGDEKPDFVGSEENGVDSGAKTVWWEQPADPTQPGWMRRPIVTQGTTNSMDVADFDDDGDMDVVTGEHRGALAVTVFENDGAGGFTAHAVDEGKESHLGVRPFDLDDDGDLDLVSIAWDAPEEIHLWRNDSGAEVPFGHVGWAPVPIDEGVTAHDVEVADMNGDTKLDVVIRGHFGPTTLVRAADIGADGDVDIVGAN